MKKRLLLLPLIGGFLLAGCELQLFGKTIKLFEKDKTEQKENKKTDNTDTTDDPVLDEDPVLKESFQGYKLVKSVQDGKKYKLGVYKHADDKMRFFNGDYHRDGGAFYPFYLGMGDEDDIACAADVEVHFVSETEFTMQVSCDESLPWNGKYISVYSATSGYNNNVMSYALLDSPTQTEYIDPKSEQAIESVPNALFKFYTTYTEKTCYAIAADYQHPEADDSANAKFMGTGPKFRSIDCNMNADVAMQGYSYDLAHFYEAE